MKMSVFLVFGTLTQMHSDRPKLYTILAFLSATGLMVKRSLCEEGNYSISQGSPR